MKSAFFRPYCVPEHRQLWQQTPADKKTHPMLINTKTCKRLSLSLFLSLLIWPVASFAQSEPFQLENKPVWEAGLGAGYFRGTDYPGSNDPNIGRFALPFFIYRSKIFRFGDGGVGAVAVEEPRLKIDVSLGGSLNATPKVDSVRAGMPDLDLLFEFGPQIQYKLFQRDWANGSSSEATIDGNVRAVISTDFEDVEGQGFVYGAGISYIQRNVIKDKVDIVLGADITFADRRYNDYLYSVPSEFATPQRDAYTANAGYVETAFVLGLGLQPHPDLRIFTGFSVISHAGAANEESPLFETDLTTRYAIGIVWTALRSKRSIEVY